MSYSTRFRTSSLYGTYDIVFTYIDLTRIDIHILTDSNNIAQKYLKYALIYDGAPNVSGVKKVAYSNERDCGN